MEWSERNAPHPILRNGEGMTESGRAGREPDGTEMAARNMTEETGSVSIIIIEEMQMRSRKVMRGRTGSARSVRNITARKMA